MAEPVSDDLLTRYFAAVQERRMKTRQALLSKLTKREQALIREAAVMGYVQGAEAPKDREIPADSDILAMVIDGCLAFPDLYPALRRVRRRAETVSADK